MHPLHAIAQVQTAVVFRDKAPQEEPQGNVRTLAIRDLVANRPLLWYELPRMNVQEKYLVHCLEEGDVVIPSRGDYYKAWLFEGADEPVFPLGQLNVIRPSKDLDARYLVWYLNQRSTQVQITSALTGTNIKALTKVALLNLDVEVPPLPQQHQIADLDRTTRQIAVIRHQLSELDKTEMAYLTKQILKEGVSHA